MAYRAGHPGQPGDHELVPGPEVIEAGIPFGAAGQAPGSDIGPDPLAPGIGPAGRAGRREREDALAASAEAAEIYRELAAACPDAFRPALAMSLANLTARLAELRRREEALAAIQEATDLCRELAARWPGAYHQELEQSLRVAAWLEHGEDLSDASPREPK